MTSVHAEDSLFERAHSFFSGLEQAELTQLQQQIEALQQKLLTAGKAAQSKVAARLLECQQQQKDKLRQLEELRVDRVRQLKQLARMLLTQCIGDSPQESHLLAARALGTIQLLSPSSGKQVAAINQRHKHALQSHFGLVVT